MTDTPKHRYGAPCYGVFRVLSNGEHKYVGQSATFNKKLAEDIAAGLSVGEVVTPYGGVRQVIARPHIVKEIP